MLFYSVIIAFLIPLIGQFGRISMGSGGILLLDLYVPLVILLWGIFKIRAKENVLQRFLAFPLFWPILLVLSLFLASLCFNAFWLPSKDILEGFFYWIRIASILGISAVIFDIAQHDSRFSDKNIILWLAGIGSLFAVLGFLQLFFYPDFGKMAELGWDPHIGRLLSTWFDPNFMGSFFSYVLIILMSVVAMEWRAKVHSIADAIQILKTNRFLQILFGAIFLLLVALLFTYSRSALLAFLVPATLLGIAYFRSVFIVACLMIGLLLPFSDRAMQRISDGVSSAFSVANEHSLFVPDATARLRVENFQEGLVLGNEHFFTGIGFNVIRTYKTENIHSSGGFDSSLLTVFVTSGAFGLFAFLLLFWKAFSLALRKTTESKTAKMKGIGIGIVLNFFGVLAQSFFINSLFFPFFIIYFWGLIAWFLAQKSTR